MTGRLGNTATIGTAVGCVALLAAVAVVAWAAGAFRAQVPITVVNDLGHSVDLACLWDNRDGLVPGDRTTLLVDAHDGSTEYGCLVLDARGRLVAPQELRLTDASTDPSLACST
ncbi:hypothetical protein QUG98_05365 [Curtobacterium sp. RHCJP20]|uniref:Uncharacterized protein n=1 Tax=Curtobacterium subtropicum TaxID=3055138 RepID=A0ABT7TE92_9MICO|nr:hypothetical protein [Curtobacterium subtropicum]MDM7887880.1 hypothetical protein [Curtobacterium subtropicum]